MRQPTRADQFDDAALFVNSHVASEGLGDLGCSSHSEEGDCHRRGGQEPRRVVRRPAQTRTRARFAAARHVAAQAGLTYYAFVTHSAHVGQQQGGPLERQVYASAENRAEIPRVRKRQPPSDTAKDARATRQKATAALTSFAQLYRTEGWRAGGTGGLGPSMTAGPKKAKNAVSPTIGNAGEPNFASARYYCLRGGLLGSHCSRSRTRRQRGLYRALRLATEVILGGGRRPHGGW